MKAKPGAAQSSTALPAHPTPESPAPAVPRGNLMLLIAGWLLLVIFVATAVWLDDYRSGVRAFQAGWAVGMVGYGLLVTAVWRTPGNTSDRSWCFWLAGFVALRVALLGTVPSDDLHRYVWEGTIQNAGFNPYVHAPLDPAVAAIAATDPNWQQINHPDYPAIYPPLAQLVFRVVSSVSLSVYAMKAVWVGADIITIVLLGRLLTLLHLPRARAVIYAASPLTLSAFAIDGHLDALMLGWLVVAGIAAQRRHWYACGALLGLAIASKLVCAVAWCWLWQRHRRAALLTPVIVAVSYLPFADAGRDLFASLTRFGMTGSSMLNWLTGTTGRGGEIGARIAAGIVLVVMLVVQLRPHPSFGTFATRSLATLALLLPVKHFWYLTWFLVFAWSRVRVSWLLLTGLMGLYFEAERQRVVTNTWAQPAWVLRTIAGAFIAAWCVESWIRRQRRVTTPDPGVCPPESH